MLAWDFVSRRRFSSLMRMVEAMSIPGAAIYRRVRLLRTNGSLDVTTHGDSASPGSVFAVLVVGRTITLHGSLPPRLEPAALRHLSPCRSLGSGHGRLDDVRVPSWPRGSREILALHPATKASGCTRFGDLIVVGFLDTSVHPCSSHTMRRNERYLEQRRSTDV